MWGWAAHWASAGDLYWGACLFVLWSTVLWGSSVLQLGVLLMQSKLDVKKSLRLQDSPNPVQLGRGVSSAGSKIELWCEACG